MINVGKHAKLKFHWKVSPYDFSIDKQKSIISKASKKYSIPKDRIKVIPDFITLKEDGTEFSITTDVINNIQEPSFQLKLFQDYIKLKQIEDLDFDLIKKIDAEINARIDYQVYDKYRRYSIKWIEWSNFLSYGQSNRFDFTTLHGLTLLNGFPANQSGKTTFAVDLLHFLLFGKTSKVSTQDKIFNKHLKEETHVSVEGCLVIDGEEYIIKRTLSRPTLSKRSSKSKTTQKVEYFKIIGGSKEELVDYIDNYQEENSIQTNKAIKEAIGQESDFDLILSITESNLDELIEKKEAERGKLLSRWIGLMPIEEKNTIAREKFNSEVKPYFISNQFTIEDIEADNTSQQLNINALINQNKNIDDDIKNIQSTLSQLERNQEALLTTKRQIDESLLKVDIFTLDKKIETVTAKGKNLNPQYQEITQTLDKIGTVDFSIEEYEKINGLYLEHNSKRVELLTDYKELNKQVKALTEGQFCPTCGHKLDGVDNSKAIEETRLRIKKIEVQGNENNRKIKEYENQLLALKKKHEEYNLFSKYTMQKSALELQLANLRNEYKDLVAVKKEYEKNKESIDINTQIDIQIRNNKVQIDSLNKKRDYLLGLLSANNTQIEEKKKKITSNNDLIEKIKVELKLIKAWKVYLEMVGKDGISKMVLKKALPIINAKLAQILSDVCDFDIEIEINAKNDVTFNLIKDNVVSDLSSGSGFEKTASALALRAVLSNISMLPKLSGMIMDELWGRVAKDNYDNMKLLVEKISEDYQWVIIITHLEEMKEWCNQCITVTKTDNISSLKLSAISQLKN